MIRRKYIDKSSDNLTRSLQARLHTQRAAGSDLGQDAISLLNAISQQNHQALRSASLSRQGTLCDACLRGDRRWRPATLPSRAYGHRQQPPPRGPGPSAPKCHVGGAMHSHARSTSEGDPSATPVRASQALAASCNAELRPSCVEAPPAASTTNASGRTSYSTRSLAGAESATGFRNRPPPFSTHQVGHIACHIEHYAVPER